MWNRLCLLMFIALSVRHGWEYVCVYGAFSVLASSWENEVLAIERSVSAVSLEKVFCFFESWLQYIQVFCRAGWAVLTECVPSRTGCDSRSDMQEKHLCSRILCVHIPFGNCTLCNLLFLFMSYFVIFQFHSRELNGSWKGSSLEVWGAMCKSSEEARSHSEVRGAPVTLSSEVLSHSS